VTLIEELSGLVQALDAAGVEYGLVGALALAVWGSPRATQDIDLLVRADALERAREVARTRGFVLEALPIRFQDGMELRRVTKIDPAGGHLTLDLILVSPNLEAVWSSRQSVPFGEFPLQVVSRDALIAMKLSAGRPQDLVDVQRLQEQDR
jgi:hypothetical protein